MHRAWPRAGDIARGHWRPLARDGGDALMLIHSCISRKCPLPRLDRRGLRFVRGLSESVLARGWQSPIWSSRSGGRPNGLPIGLPGCAYDDGRHSRVVMAMVC